MGDIDLGLSISSDLQPQAHEEEKTTSGAISLEDDFVNVTIGDENDDKEEFNKKVTFFKTSNLPQSQELIDYLNELIIKKEENYFCIDCRIYPSTHALIWYGTFVCQNCA